MDIVILAIIAAFTLYLFINKRKKFIPLDNEVAKRRYPTFPFLKNMDDDFDYFLKTTFNVVRNPKDLERNQHFYLLAKTSKVSMPDHLRKQHPEELMCLVFDENFQISNITDEGFEALLYFDYKPETLFIPFSSISLFADPPIGFALQRPQLVNDLSNAQ